MRTTVIGGMPCVEQTPLWLNAPGTLGLCEGEFNLTRGSYYCWIVARAMSTLISTIVVIIVARTVTIPILTILAIFIVIHIISLSPLSLPLSTHTIITLIKLIMIIITIIIIFPIVFFYVSHIKLVPKLCRAAEQDLRWALSALGSAFRSRWWPQRCRRARHTNGSWENSWSSGLKQCEAPKIAKLVNITPITMVYGTYNELVTGAYKPTYNWGASHCSDTDRKRMMIVIVMISN